LTCAHQEPRAINVPIRSHAQITFGGRAWDSILVVRLSITGLFSVCGWQRRRSRTRFFVRGWRECTRRVHDGQFHKTGAVPKCWQPMSTDFCRSRSG
jgi:hypothetical protein